jgi:tetratricopeptide (TPR) repeat protein
LGGTLTLRFLVFAALIFNSVAGFAVAQGHQALVAPHDNPNGIGEDPLVESAVQLAIRFVALKKALIQGDEPEIQKAMLSLDQYRGEHGFHDLTPLIEAICIWAIELGSDGKFDTANRTVALLGQWAPNHPIILRTEVALKRQEGFDGIMNGFASLIKLKIMRFENPATLRIFVLHHLAWVKYMVTILLWSLALVLALKYQRVLRGQLELPLAKFIENRHVISIIAVIILTMPILLGFNPSLNALLWLLMLTSTINSSEFKIVIICLMLQLSYPGFLIASDNLIATDRPLSMQTLQFQPQLIALKSRPVGGLSKQDIKFLDGWEALQSSNWKKAEQLFQSLSDESFEVSATLNNLGVALQHQHKADLAYDMFARSANYDQSSPESLYNLAVIEFTKMEYEKAEKRLIEARRIDYAGRYRHILDLAIFSKTKSFAMPIKDTPTRLDALSKSYSELYPSFKNELPSDMADLRIILGLILPVVGILGMAVLRRYPFVFGKRHQCAKCGYLFQETVDLDSVICSQCYHLYVAKDSNISEHRLRKIKDIHNFQNRQKWQMVIFAVAVPGSDRIFQGFTVSGFTTLLLVSISVSVAISFSHGILYPGEITPDPPSLLKYAGIFFLGVIYLRSWLNIPFVYKSWRQS